jgi:hypothetical protein
MTYFLLLRSIFASRPIPTSVSTCTSTIAASFCGRSERGAGQHTVTVQARLDAGDICYSTKGYITTCSTNQVVNTSLASSISAALFGLGSVTVIPVQLAPGFSF